MSETPEAERIRTERAGGIFTITFNRPEKKNAFTLAMYEALVSAFEAADRDPEVRVLLLRGAGGAFTSGNDLADFMHQPPTGEDSPVFRFLVALTGARKPIVAAVQGPAVGIGSTMLLHTDLAYAAEDAKLRLPFVSLGLVPEGASSYLLPRIAGPQKAAELLYFAEAFDARTAKEAGLVAEVVPADALEAHARAKAEALAAQPLGALIETKRLLREGVRDQVHQALAREGAKFVERLTSAEAMEAFSAFFEKRKPDFSKLSVT